MTILGTRREDGLRHYIVDDDGWVVKPCTYSKYIQGIRGDLKPNRHATCLYCHALVHGARR